MYSLKLFRPTFLRFQEIIKDSIVIKDQILPQARSEENLENIARKFTMLNFIQKNIAELQMPKIEQQFRIFEEFLQKKKMSVQFDYKEGFFKISNYEPINEQIFDLCLKVKTCKIEKIDDPFSRKGGLYFHQLKDVEKYVKIQYMVNSPGFFKKIQREITQNQVLNKQNPLGVPITSPKLKILMSINKKFEALLEAKLGEIRLAEVRCHSIPQQSSFKDQPVLLRGKRLPVLSHKILFSILKDLQIEQNEVFLLHKMAYIGGIVQKIEQYMNIYQYFLVKREKLLEEKIQI